MKPDKCKRSCKQRHSTTADVSNLSAHLSTSQVTQRIGVAYVVPLPSNSSQVGPPRT
jgi:hypothetical protein